MFGRYYALLAASLMSAILHLLLPHLLLHLFSSAGLPKSSEQAYIEFESIEAIVKTASRTKFFIEFYSTCLEGESKVPASPQDSWRQNSFSQPQLRSSFHSKRTLYVLKLSLFLRLCCPLLSFLPS